MSTSFAACLCEVKKLPKMEWRFGLVNIVSYTFAVLITFVIIFGLWLRELVMEGKTAGSLKQIPVNCPSDHSSTSTPISTRANAWHVKRYTRSPATKLSTFLCWLPFRTTVANYHCSAVSQKFNTQVKIQS